MVLEFDLGTFVCKEIFDVDNSMSCVEIHRDGSWLIEIPNISLPDEEDEEEVEKFRVIALDYVHDALFNK